jgi:hypothetical protein
VGALWSSVLVASLVVGFTTTSVASHYWGQWKYADAYINYYNGATGNYYTHFQEEALLDLNGWNRYTDVHLTQVGSAGTTDHINAYSGFYGNNGWLGIAEILQYSGWTVKEGRCRLNRSYLDFGYSSTNIKHVACQEVGHLFGLGHNHNSNATCMNDYILTAPQPDLHDQEIVNQKY